MKSALIAFTTLAFVMGASASQCLEATSDQGHMCKQLANGGLYDLSALGCGNVNASPNLKVLKRRSHPVPESIQSAPSSPACQDGGKAGYAGVGLLGCSNTNVVPDVNVLRRRSHPVPASIQSQPSSQSGGSMCQAMKNAGFASLDLLGCGNTNVDPNVAVARRQLQTLNTVCEDFEHGGLLNLDAIGCPLAKRSSNTETVNIKRAEGAEAHTEQLRARHEVCARYGDLGLDLRSFGCAESHINKKRDATVPCEDMAQSGFANLGLLGCSNTNAFPNVNVLRRSCSGSVHGSGSLHGNGQRGGSGGVQAQGSASGSGGLGGNILGQAQGLLGGLPGMASGVAAQGLGEGMGLAGGLPGLAGAIPGLASSFGLGGDGGSGSASGSGSISGGSGSGSGSNSHRHPSPNNGKRHHPQPSTIQTQSSPQPAACTESQQSMCQKMGAANLLNLDLLGCGGVNASPNMDLLGELPAMMKK